MPRRQRQARHTTNVTKKIHQTLNQRMPVQSKHLVTPDYFCRGRQVTLQACLMEGLAMQDYSEGRRGMLKRVAAAQNVAGITGKRQVVFHSYTE